MVYLDGVCVWVNCGWIILIKKNRLTSSHPSTPASDPELTEKNESADNNNHHNNKKNNNPQIYIVTAR